MALRAAGKQVLVCVGDSHLEPLRSVQRRRLLPATLLRITVVTGATASGIANPNSSTKALPRLQAAAAMLSRGCPVLVCLGEIDAGFLVFLRSQRDGLPVRELTDEALARYQEFITRELLDRGARLMMLSASMPTVDSYSTWAGLGGARRQVTATRERRAAETRYWNEQCEAWCKSVEGTWLDLTEETTGPDGRVRAEYLNEDPEDHHLHPERYGNLVAKLLRQQGFR